MTTMSKLHHLSSNIKPSLNKDLKLIQVETFYKLLFKKNLNHVSNGH